MICRMMMEGVLRHVSCSSSGSGSSSSCLVSVSPVRFSAPTLLPVTSLAYEYAHARKYRDPLPVVTTSLFATFPLAIGLVVMRSPSSKDGEPLINPVIDPSRFFLHRFSVGIPLGAVLAGLAAGFFTLSVERAGGGDAFRAGAAGLAGAFFSSLPAKPNRENVCLGVGCGFDAAGFGLVGRTFSFSFLMFVSWMVPPLLKERFSMAAANPVLAGSALKK